MNNGLFQACHHRAGHYALLLAAGSALFRRNLGGASLWDVEEGRNSPCAWAMWESGNYIVPYFNGELRVDKPALLYWLQAGAYQLFGFNEFSARLPSALAALLTILLCYELGRRLFTPLTGLLGGLVLASTPMVCGAARFANPDALLNCLTVLTLYFFWRGLPKAGWFWFVSMGITTGLAVLDKGLVGVILPLAVIGLFLLEPIAKAIVEVSNPRKSWFLVNWVSRFWNWLVWNRRLRLLVDVRFFLGFLAFCLVALPWYVLVAMETKGEFLRGFFLNHNFQRYLNTMEDHRGSMLYYPMVLLLGFAPWSIFLGLAFWYGGWSVVKKPWSWLAGCWARAADHGIPQPEAQARIVAANEPSLACAAGYRFLVCWIGVYLLFFSLAATKLPNYILPLAVPTALLIGRFLERWRLGLIQPPPWVMPLALIGVAVVGLL